MSKIYEAATSQENWHGVAYHLAAGAPHMIETHDRNVDDDFSDVEGAKEMLVTSTEVERVFAVGNVVAARPHTSPTPAGKWRSPPAKS